MPDGKTIVANGDEGILLSPPTFARHAAAVGYVEGEVRTRAPRPGTSRSPGLAPGAWGLLAAGDTITAASGITLGTGSVKLCDRSGTVLPADESVGVVNAGEAIAAGGADLLVGLDWVEGEWAACGCGATSDCGCPTITGTITGCSGNAVPGATVTAHDATSGGTVLGTATTNSGGVYSLATSGCISGNNIVVVITSPSARLNGRTYTLTWIDPTVSPFLPPGASEWACGYNTAHGTTNLAAATGYTCCSPCGASALTGNYLPVKTTLTVSGTGGTWTVNFSGGSWQTSATCNTLTGSPIPKATMTTTECDTPEADGSLAVAVAMRVSTCGLQPSPLAPLCGNYSPAKFKDPSNCSDIGSFGGVFMTNDIVSQATTLNSCNPLSVTYSFTLSTGPGSYAHLVLGTSTPSWTITE